MRKPVGWCLVSLMMLTSFSSLANADLHQYYIRSVEWLTANSDIIVVVHEGASDNKDQRAIRLTLKGDRTRIKWPLKPVKLKGFNLYAPPDAGAVRVLFIRGRSELLQAVQLDRDQVVQTPTIHDVFYGVTQYGELILSESALIDAIQSQTKAPVSRQLRQRKTSWSSPHFARSGVSAPNSFPLESNGQTFVLIVPLNESRRDHFVKKLQNGNASERLHAIWELSQYDDAKAMAAIRAATTIDNVEPSFQRNGSGVFVMVKSADVRSKANQALKLK